MSEAGFNKYINSYAGKKLLEEHSLSEDGTWHIRGEDPNCDLGGVHHNPSLGYIKGKLSDVIHAAVDMKGFWTWGGGGIISKSQPPKVKTVAEVKRDDAELRELLKQRDEIDARIKALCGE